MKFAFLNSYALSELKQHGKNKLTGHINIGDAIRDYALIQLYSQMGIEPVSLNFDDLATYSGETVVLPINNFLGYPYGFSPFPLSHKIIPVFLSLAMHSVELCDPKFYLPYQPIGCRDEYTMRLLQSKGIQCYFSGCMSLTYKKCAKIPKDGKVFFVDTPDALSNYVPEEIKNRAVYLSHIFPISAVTYDEFDAELGKIIFERLDMYKNEATLVVSTKVHCIAPCLAMGIPVIFVTDEKEPIVSINGSFLDNIIPYYSVSEYSKINWYPQVVDIEHIKKIMLMNAENAIREAYEKNRLRADLTDAFTVKRSYSVSYNNFYIDALQNPIPCRDGEVFRGLCSKEDAYSSGTREGVRYPFINSFLMEAIEKLAGNHLSQIRLIIFGAGNEGKLLLYEFKHLPRSFKSMAFIDNNKSLYGTSIADVPVFPVDYLRGVDLSETFILLTGSYHEEMALQLEKEYGLQEKKHFWKSCRIVSTNIYDWGYTPVMKVHNLTNTNY